MQRVWAAVLRRHVRSYGADTDGSEQGSPFRFHRSSWLAPHVARAVPLGASALPPRALADHAIAAYPLIVRALVRPADRAPWPLFVTCALLAVPVREEACRTAAASRTRREVATLRAFADFDPRRESR